MENFQTLFPASRGYQMKMEKLTSRPKSLLKSKIHLGFQQLYKSLKNFINLYNYSFSAVNIKGSQDKNL